MKFLKTAGQVVLGAIALGVAAKVAYDKKDVLVAGAKTAFDESKKLFGKAKGAPAMVAG